MDLLEYSDDELEAAAAARCPAPAHLPPPFAAAAHPAPPRGLLFLPAPGQDACLIYLHVRDCPASALRAHVAEGFGALGLPPPAAAPLPSSALHVSLSRPFPLRAHCVAPLRERLQRSLAACGTPAFSATLASRAVFVNEARSAAFLALLLAPAPAPLALAAAVDRALADFGVAPMHSPPRLHASIAQLPQGAPLPPPAGDGAALPVHYAPVGAAAPCAGTSPVDALFAPSGAVARRREDRGGSAHEAAAAAAGPEEAEGAHAGAGAHDFAAASAPLHFAVTHVCFRAGRDTFHLPLPGVEPGP